MEKYLKGLMASIKFYEEHGDEIRKEELAGGIRFKSFENIIKDELANYTTDPHAGDALIRKFKLKKSSIEFASEKRVFDGFKTGAGKALENEIKLRIKGVFEENEALKKENEILRSAIEIVGVKKETTLFNNALVINSRTGEISEILTYSELNLDEDNIRYSDVELFGFSNEELENCINQVYGTGSEYEFVAWKRDDEFVWNWRADTDVQALVDSQSVCQEEIDALKPNEHGDVSFKALYKY